MLIFLQTKGLHGRSSEKNSLSMMGKPNQAPVNDMHHILKQTPLVRDVYSCAAVHVLSKEYSLCERPPLRFSLDCVLIACCFCEAVFACKAL